MSFPCGEFVCPCHPRRGSRSRRRSRSTSHCHAFPEDLPHPITGEGPFPFQLLRQLHQRIPNLRNGEDVPDLPDLGVVRHVQVEYQGPEHAIVMSVFVMVGVSSRDELSCAAGVSQVRDAAGELGLSQLVPGDGDHHADWACAGGDRPLRQEGIAAGVLWIDGVPASSRQIAIGLDRGPDQRVVEGDDSLPGQVQTVRGLRCVSAPRRELKEFPEKRDQQPPGRIRQSDQFHRRSVLQPGDCIFETSDENCWL